MRIVVGYLASTTTEDDLQELCAPDGSVTLVRMVTRRQTGRALGYGSVEMPNATEAQAAMAGLQGATLEGRTLTVQRAYEREGKARWPAGYAPQTNGRPEELAGRPLSHERREGWAPRLMPLVAVVRARNMSLPLPLLVQG